MKTVSSNIGAPRTPRGAAPAARSVKDQTSGLEFPKDGVELARNERPVILLHGTLVEKEGIAAYRDFSLDAGHPVDHRTYPSITNGQPIEKSAELASRGINQARQHMAERNVDRLKDASAEELDSFFQLDANLYGAKDGDTDKIRSLLSPLVADVEALLEQPKGNLEATLSGKLKVLQGEIESKLSSTGVKNGKSAKIAAELLDSIAPKAIVVGHSAGGYVGYALTVNPEETPDKDPFTFDGGNGVGQMVVLSAPIGAGLPTPAPPGILDLGFYQVDSQVLRPIENHPFSQLALLNPLFGLGYHAMKDLTKQAFHVANYVTIGLMNPMIHQLRPGNAQVEENSEFFKTHLQGKRVPDGVSVIAVTSPLDMLVQEARAKVDDTQPNAHNFSADLKVSDADIKRERPTWAHVIMTEKPDSFKEQFAATLADPKALARLLDPKNDDGARYEALEMIRAQLEANPKLLTGAMKRTLQAVAAEKAPFKDSPSYLAYQLLR